MSYLGVLCSSFKKLLSYLKSTSSNLCNCKVWFKNKNPSTWDQQKFGTALVFSKGPGSTFSESQGQGPSLGALYKVCPHKKAYKYQFETITTYFKIISKKQD